MALTNTNTAWLEGIELQMESLDDDFDKAIVQHDYPYFDGAKTEDLGLKARQINMRCYFWDDAKNNTYDQHQDLINLLYVSDVMQLIHPVYGVLNTRISRMVVRHDERKRLAEIDLSLVEDGVPALAATEPYTDVAAAMEDLFVAGQQDLIDATGDSIMDDVPGVEGRSLIDTLLDAGKEVMGQINGLTATARSYIAQVETGLTTVEATLTQIAAPANSLVSLVNYTTALPGRMVGSLAGCMERYARACDSLVNSPARFLDSFRTGTLQLEAALGVNHPLIKPLRVARAQRAALEASAMFKDEEDARRAQAAQPATPPFDVIGRFTAPADPGTILTVRDVETALDLARQMIQEGIDADRTVSSLAPMARTLTDHVAQVKLQLMQVVTVDVDGSIPLPLLCHRRGLGYRQSPAVAKLNPTMKNANFVSGKVQIYG